MDVIPRDKMVITFALKNIMKVKITKDFVLLIGRMYVLCDRDLKAHFQLSMEFFKSSEFKILKIH